MPVCLVCTFYSPKTRPRAFKYSSQKFLTAPVIPSPARDLYWNIVPCVISAERKRAEKSLAKSCKSFILFVWQYRLHTALARRSKDPFEGARSFTLLARGKTSAPQSAAYGRMPMATCCRKRQLFSCRLPSVSEWRNLWQHTAGAVCSLFGNMNCIQSSRSGAKIRSARRRSFSAARSG